MNNTSNVIKIIILVNAVFYLVTFYFPGMHDWMFNHFSLFFPENQKFAVWQFVTTMFMHGGFFHILFNMYALWAFGSPLAQIWGDKRFTFFYFLSGIGASAIYTLVNIYQFNHLQPVVSDFLKMKRLLISQPFSKHLR